MKSGVIDLSEFRPKRHPLAEAFKGRVPIAVLANYLGVTPARIFQMFSGVTGMPERHRARLEALKSAIEAGRVRI